MQGTMYNFLACFKRYPAELAAMYIHTKQSGKSLKNHTWFEYYGTRKERKRLDAAERGTLFKCTTAVCLGGMGSNSLTS